METSRSVNEIVKEWESMGLLNGINDEIKKKNTSMLYEKMAQYLLSKESSIKNEFENAAFAIIFRVILTNGSWNGPFIPKEIEEVYNSYYESFSNSNDTTAEACLKTAEHFSKNKSENKPKNGRIPSVC